jgi:predicted dehydrogenase
MQPKTIAIIGAGMRGTGVAETIHQFAYLGTVVAVAEPREGYRQHLANACQIPAGNQFHHWKDFCAQPKMCDAVVIATMDQDHVGPAVACLDKGYDVLLEKPMATSLADCRAIEAAQRRSGAIVGVCHSLRYQKGFRKVKELVDAGAIGRIVTLDQLEPVGFWHQAHSFVRGNWGNEGRSTFMLLAKSCHDIDYIAYLVGKPCRQVSSFGSLSFFRRENAPTGSTERCTDPCPVEPACAYSAVKQYVNTPHRAQWPANVVSFDHSYEAHLEAIRTGPYGRCVWKCDNDVVDHQVVSMLFDGDVTATFTMTAFNVGGGRKLRVSGTEGELIFEEPHIQIKTFADRNTQQIQIGAEPGGHGGGDTRVVRDWLLALHSRDDSQIVANAQESLRTHTIVFAAEKSRRTGQTINIAEF